MARSHRQLSQGLAVLGLDLEALLQQEPRLLLDAEFLGSLHAELAERLAPDEARAALLQLGFLHGLRDALVVLRSGFAPLEPPARGPASTRLAIRLVRTREARSEPKANGVTTMGSGASFAGSWPEGLEARAVGASPHEAAAPCCHVSAGYTSGWLSGILDADVLALEQRCRTAGHEACRFLAREAGAWGDEARDGLDALPFDALRELAARHLPPADESELAADRFEAGSPVIHVWGPVMILPFAGADECLRSLDLIGRDPGARAVRVVVVDLAGTVIDDGFGAASLEQVLDAVAGWGAEPILTGISPLSERAVTDLEKTHLVIRKDLPEAIAAAFQIADAQRRPA